MIAGMKPSTTVAMRQLIEQIRNRIPLASSAADLCRDSDNCNVCALKLTEYLNMQLEDWEYRLDNQQIPNFGDLKKLAQSAEKIHHALKKGGFIDRL